MPSYVTAKLPSRVIPLTKGCDAKLSLRRRDPATGAEINWVGDVYMLIDIVKDSPPERVNATASGSLAVVVIQSETADLCKTGTTWRIVLSDTGADPSFECALMVGTFERNDGK